MLIQVYIIHAVINNTMRFWIQSLQNKNQQKNPLNLEIKWSLNYFVMHSVAVLQLFLGLFYHRHRTRFPDSHRSTDSCQ